MFDFKKEHLAAMIPGNKNVTDWYVALMEVMPNYGITTERRIAHFISQCAHESNNFRSLSENLNYSEKALNAVFGRYFGAAPKRNAAEYARNPQLIANYVYQDEFRKYKMGNVNPDVKTIHVLVRVLTSQQKKQQITFQHQKVLLKVLAGFGIQTS